jgi:replication factor A1
VIVLDLEVLDEYWPVDKIGEPVLVEMKNSDDSHPTDTTISTNGFYGKVGQPQQQAQAQGQSLPARSNPGVSNSGHPNIYPIEGLSPYAHKWAIKARCTHKSDIKRWNNKNGEGRLFSVNLLDESGEIRATGFNDQCDALYDLFQDGGVYYITSPCRVQLAKKQFSNLSNDYELMFERDTQVEKVRTLENRTASFLTFYTGRGFRRRCTSSQVQLHADRGPSISRERDHHRYDRDLEGGRRSQSDCIKNH